MTHLVYRKRELNIEYTFIWSGLEAVYNYWKQPVAILHQFSSNFILSEQFSLVIELSDLILIIYILKYIV